MSVFDWSTTAADNDDADSNINWSEGQAPSTVNDSARAEMARIAHWRNMLGANVTMGGTSNAYTYTTGESLSAYSDGIRLLWQPNANPTGAVTLNVDTLGAKKVYMPDGTQAGNGELDADSLYDVVYDSSLDSSSGAFKIVGFPDTTLTAADYLTAANNLSDVASASTARSNLGLGDMSVGDYADAQSFGSTVDITGNLSFGGTLSNSGDVIIMADGGEAREWLRDTGSVVEKRFYSNTAGRDIALYFGDGADSTRAGFYYDTSENELQIRGYDNSNAVLIDSAGDVRVINEMGVHIGDASPQVALEVGRLGAQVSYTPVAGTTAVFHPGGASTSSPSVVQILSGSAANATLAFGHSSNPDAWAIEYNASTDELKVENDGVDVLTFNSSGNADFNNHSARAKAVVNSSVSGTLNQNDHLENCVSAINGNITIPTASGGCVGTFCAHGSGSITVTRGSGLAMYVNGVNVASATIPARGVVTAIYQTGSIVHMKGDIS